MFALVVDCAVREAKPLRPTLNAAICSVNHSGPAAVVDISLQDARSVLRLVEFGGTMMSSMDCRPMLDRLRVVLPGLELGHIGREVRIEGPVRFLSGQRALGESTTLTAYSFIPNQ